MPDTTKSAKERVWRRMYGGRTFHIISNTNTKNPLALCGGTVWSAEAPANGNFTRCKKCEAIANGK